MKRYILITLIVLIILAGGFAVYSSGVLPSLLSDEPESPFSEISGSWTGSGWYEGGLEADAKLIIDSNGIWSFTLTDRTMYKRGVKASGYTVIDGAGNFHFEFDKSGMGVVSTLKINGASIKYKDIARNSFTVSK